MKKKFWLFQMPFVFLCTFAYLVLFWGAEAELNSPFLREKVFPRLRTFSGFFTDKKFHMRGPQPPKNKIVIVEVDSPSIETFGRWPWHRDVTGLLISKIAESGAKVIGLDMVFSEPDQRVPPELAE